MGNSPEMYEAWRQNARPDHDQLAAWQAGRKARSLRAELASRIPDLLAAEPSEETLALADAMPGCGQREPHSDQVTATLYVGLNHPNSGDWYLQDVGNVVSARHDGFTMTNGVGYWRGKQERCAIVVISDERSAILATVASLNRVLSQECIGVTCGPAMQFI